jgi:hypothetical protein
VKKLLVLPAAALALSIGAAGCSSNAAPAQGSASASAANAEPSEPTVKQMTADDVDQRLAKNDATFHVYDANEKEVFDAGHVPGAKWVPFNAVTADMLPPNKDDTLVFYCANEH